MNSNPETTIAQDLNEEINAVETHPVFEAYGSLDDLRTFLEYHVYAVWDFLTLLDAFQNPDNHTEPWTPPVGYQWTDNLIHRLGYRETANGNVVTNLDAYWESMRVVGADSDGIHRLLSALEHGESVEIGLSTADAPAEARQHVRTTMDIAQTGDPTRIAGAIATRRDFIPDDFSADLRRLHKENIQTPDIAVNDEARCYTAFDQPMELDWEQHGDRILSDDRVETTEARRADMIDSAKKMLDARKTLLDGIKNTIQTRSGVNGVAHAEDR